MSTTPTPNPQAVSKFGNNTSNQSDFWVKLSDPNLSESPRITSNLTSESAICNDGVSIFIFGMGVAPELPSMSRIIDGAVVITVTEMSAKQNCAAACKGFLYYSTGAGVQRFDIEENVIFEDLNNDISGTILGISSSADWVYFLSKDGDDYYLYSYQPSDESWQLTADFPAADVAEPRFILACPYINSQTGANENKLYAISDLVIAELDPTEGTFLQTSFSLEELNNSTSIACLVGLAMPHENFPTIPYVHLYAAFPDNQWYAIFLPNALDSAYTSLGENSTSIITVTNDGLTQMAENGLINEINPLNITAFYAPHSPGQPTAIVLPNKLFNLPQANSGSLASISFANSATAETWQKAPIYWNVNDSNTSPNVNTAPTNESPNYPFLYDANYFTNAEGTGAGLEIANPHWDVEPESLNLGINYVMDGETGSWVIGTVDMDPMPKII